MVRTPLAEVRVEAEGHHAGRVGVAVDRKFLDRDLGLRGLQFASERHQHGRTADGRVEHLYKALLAGNVRILQIGEHSLFQVLARNLAGERIPVLDRSDGGL